MPGTVLFSLTCIIIHLILTTLWKEKGLLHLRDKQAYFLGLGDDNHPLMDVKWYLISLLKTNWHHLKVFKGSFAGIQCCLKWIKMINIFNHVFVVVHFCWHDTKYIWEQESLCFNKRSHLSITSSFLSGCQDKVLDDGSVPYELVKKPAVTWPRDKADSDLQELEGFQSSTWQIFLWSDLTFRELYLKSLIMVGILLL